VGEAQDVFAVAVAIEADEKVACRGLPDHAAFAGRDRAARVGVVTERDDLRIGGAIAGQLAGFQPVITGCSGALNGGVQVAQEPIHPHRPGLLGILGVSFDHGEQLAEVMNVAEGVLDVGVVAVGLRTRRARRFR